MILLWGVPGDTPLAAVRDSLRGRGYPFVFLDQWGILDTEIELSAGSQVTGSVRVGKQTIDLNSVTAVYLRPYDRRKLPFIARAGRDSEAWRHAQHVEDILLSWIEMLTCIVVNQPAAMSTNYSKPYQAALIQAQGFATPDTLITTDSAAALEFWQFHGTVIYKSVSDVRSIVARLTSEHVQRLEHVAWCPTQFQQYVPGTDYRVHVVGEKVFACRITSTGDDYRYAERLGATTTIEADTLPADVVARCQRLAASLNLLVAGIDLRRTPDERWYCFEVNPSPGYTYYQDATDQPINEAIAELLAA